MNTPPRVPTGQLLARRRQAVADLYALGASTAQVAAACRIASWTVAHDLRALGIPLRPKGHRKNRLGTDPGPIQWWRYQGHEQGETEPLPPLYRRSVALDLWRATVTNSENERAAEQLGHDAIDASLAGDAEWFISARAVLTDAARYLTRMQAALDAPVALDRDDLARSLRLVRP